MPRYKVTLTEEEKTELETLIQKGGKGYRIKHAHILLKLNEGPENAAWNYERIMDAYGVCRGTIAGVAKRFVMERHGSGAGTQDTAKSCPEGNWRGGSQNLHDSMFRSAGRERPVDHADDRG